jgi:hypothetical protein
LTKKLKIAKASSFLLSFFGKKLKIAKASSFFAELFWKKALLVKGQFGRLSNSIYSLIDGITYI